jgi:hypothetical protein
MIRLILTLAFCAVSFCVVAQSDFPVQHNIYIGGGLSMAPESLAGIETADNKGYVENGPIFMVNYLTRFHRYIGAGLTLGHSRNDLNSAAVAQAFTSATTVQTEPYTLTFLTADIYGLLPVKQWHFYAKGSLGSMLPDVWEMKIENDFGSGTVKSGKKFGVTYAGALGLNYNLGKIDVGLESSLLVSEPEFEIQLKSTTYRKQWLSAFNHTVKTGFRF